MPTRAPNLRTFARATAIGVALTFALLLFPSAGSASTASSSSALSAGSQPITTLAADARAVRSRTQKVALSPDALATLRALGVEFPTRTAAMRVLRSGTVVWYDAAGRRLASFTKASISISIPSPGDVYRAAKCGASIVWFVGSNVIAVSKIVKIKKLIDKIGGIKKTAKLLLKNKGKKKKRKALIQEAGTGFVSAASAFLSVDTVVKNCGG